MRLIEETFVEIIEKVGTDHNKLLTKRALGRATGEIMTNVLENDAVCKVLDPAIILVAACSRSPK